MTTKFIIKQVKKKLDRLSQHGETPQSIYIKANQVIFKYPSGKIAQTAVSNELDELKKTLQSLLKSEFVSLYVETPEGGAMRYALEYTKNGESNTLKQVIK